MITLIHFRPAFGLPDPSPFVIKTMVLLKLAGQAYQSEIASTPGRGPKGKLPAIRDGAEMIGDSEIIRGYLERKYGIDFDRGLDPMAKAVAHSFARMLEERTYWVVVHDRWMDDRHWPTVSAAFFGGLPPVVRSLIPKIARRHVRRNLLAHGLGRHTPVEIAAMGTADIRAVAAWLGDKPYFMGGEPSGVDATVYGFIAAILVPPFATPMKAEALKHSNIVAYEQRMRERFFKEATN